MPNLRLSSAFLFWYQPALGEFTLVSPRTSGLFCDRQGRHMEHRLAGMQALAAGIIRPSPSARSTRSRTLYTCSAPCWQNNDYSSLFQTSPLTRHESVAGGSSACDRTHEDWNRDKLAFIRTACTTFFLPRKASHHSPRSA